MIKVEFTDRSLRGSVDFHGGYCSTRPTSERTRGLAWFSLQQQSGLCPVNYQGRWSPPDKALRDAVDYLGLICITNL